MTEQKVAEIIKKRAADLVSERLRNFKTAVSQAANDQKLTTRTYLTEIPQDIAPILATWVRQLADKLPPGGGYPVRLWEEAEKEVTEQLFGMFDPLQRAMVAKGLNTEGGPAEPRPDGAPIPAELTDIPF